MPKYVIEREMPMAGTLSEAELQGASQQSCRVLEEMGPQIQWVQSFVTGDKIYCIYIAPDEETVRRHAANSGFPANQVNQVAAIIDPTTAEM
jgi:Nickel responsive protein SCO4226-like